eukprot:Hpha_TRINITY_DN16952_c1_g2::TRINITY_DN16952_c1_g2_i1::g.53769::m.53769
MLGQVRHLLRSMDEALQNLPGNVQSRLYRGLAGVQLDPSVYAMSRVVLWSQFSSASTDMSVATGFAAGSYSAVFSIEGTTAVQLSHASRFGREREWLFPANCRFQVVGTLGEEFAELLGVRGLQLFDLQQVSSEQVISLKLRRMMVAIEGKDDGARVGGLFRVVKILEEGDTGAALHQLLAHDNGVVAAPECGLAMPALCKEVGCDPETAATFALFRAAEAGASSAVISSLVHLGADINSQDGELSATPLHYAAKSGEPSAISELIKSGANITARDELGKMPCEWAAGHGDAVREFALYHKLPRHLRIMYIPLSTRKAIFMAFVYILVFSFGITILATPLTECNFEASVVETQVWDIAGNGLCVNSWGVTQPILLDYLTENGTVPVERCINNRLMEPGVMGVHLVPAGRPGSVFCSSMVIPKTARLGVGPYNDDTAGVIPIRRKDLDGHEMQETPMAMCARKRKPLYVAFAYAHLAAPDAADPGYAPGRLGEACPAAATTNASGISKCGDGSSCEEGPDCCVSHGGVSQCPPDYPVKDNKTCTGSSNRTGQIEVSKCCTQPTGISPTFGATCPGPFPSCLDSSSDCPHITSCNQSVNISQVIIVYAQAAALSDGTGYTACPATCESCPGSVRAEQQQRSTSLLSDGQVSADGRGCVGLEGGVMLSLVRKSSIKRVLLEVPSDSPLSAVVSTSFGELLVLRNGSVFSVPVEEELRTNCVENFTLTTSLRVCEIRVDGEPCGDLIYSRASCGGALQHPIPQKACEGVRSQTARDVVWENGKCMASLEPEVWAPRSFEVCLALPHPADVVTEPATRSTCEMPAVQLPGYVSFEDCQELFRKMASPRLFVSLSYLGWDKICRVHAQPGEEGYVGNLTSMIEISPTAPIAKSALINTTMNITDPRVCVRLCEAVPVCEAAVLTILDHECRLYFNWIAEGGTIVEPTRLFIRQDVYWTQNEMMCLGAEFLPVPPPDRPRKYRMRMGKCPRGTTGTLTMEECGAAATELRLPTPPEATHDKYMAPGCAYFKKMLWSPEGSDSEGGFEPQLPVTVCKVLEAKREVYRLGVVEDNQRVWLTGIIAGIIVQCFLPVLLVLVFISWRAQIGKRLARRRLEITTRITHLAFLLVTILAYITFSTIRHDANEQCEHDLRADCSCKHGFSTYMSVVSAVLLAISCTVLYPRVPDPRRLYRFIANKPDDALNHTSRTGYSAFSDGREMSGGFNSFSSFMSYTTGSPRTPRAGSPRTPRGNSGPSQPPPRLDYTPSGLEETLLTSVAVAS